MLNWFKSGNFIQVTTKPTKLHTSSVETYDLFNIVAHKSVQETDLIDTLANSFDQRANTFGFETEGQRAAFIAQTAHESGGFRWLEELGKEAYFKKYDGRKDLGNTQPGDGARYKGRGIIMITGRANYAQFGRLTGLDLENDPELASDPEYAVLIALHYWSQRNINDAVDAFDFRRVTKLINGGYNGQASRVSYFKTLLDEIRDDQDKTTKIENYTL